MLHVSAPAARWVGAVAGIAGGALLYRYDDPTEHGPGVLALAAALLLVALSATWVTLERRPGWVGVGGFVLGAVALGTAFLGLLGISLSSSGGEAEVAVVALPAVIVGGFMFSLAVAFRHVRTPLSAGLWIASAVLFLTTAAWSRGFAAAWILWGLALVAEGTVDLLSGAYIRRRMSRERA
jgi:hypothetical protein